MADSCVTDSSCCYQDDSGAETLKIVCVGLATALLVAVLALAWFCIGCMHSGATRSTKERHERPESSASGTLSRSPDSMEKQPTNHALNATNLRGLRSSNSSVRSFDGSECQPRPSVMPPSPCSSVGAESVHRLRTMLDAERSRRMAAETVLGRRAGTPVSLGTPGSRRSLRRFPVNRTTVLAHIIETTANASQWVQSAIDRVGPAEPEFPSFVKSVLMHTFRTCHTEVAKRLEARVDGLRDFLGGVENVVLGGEEGSSVMAGDTQELLYGELRKRYQTIAPMGRKDLISMTAGILSRALEREDRRDFGRKLVNQTWPSFEPMIKSYLALFVECALQLPPIEFAETVGKEEMFDEAKHRELARFVEPEGNFCCIVFPAIAQPTCVPEVTSDTTKSGVVVWSSHLFQL